MLPAESAVTRPGNQICRRLMRGELQSDLTAMAAPTEHVHLFHQRHRWPLRLALKKVGDPSALVELSGALMADYREAFIRLRSDEMGREQIERCLVLQRVAVAN